MITDKTKRNIWLTLAIFSLVSVTHRAISLANGDASWWQLASSIIISAACIKFYLQYRRQAANPSEK
ncbi:MAG: hypothetical protein K2I25_03715 [Muribaculaceae bacterium]|nr:hypothetical protein [Muribaculaceae bacterium]